MANFSWRACSGGLSLADTDNDGVFEIYQGDRDMGYRGEDVVKRKVILNNLTERWVLTAFLAAKHLLGGC